MFKAGIINNFVKNNKITSIIEYGCGDGNQLRFSEYPQYIGFDISQKAISLCEEIFYNDSNKIFKLMREYSGETAQLTLSLDVIYHLIEDDIFYHYMERLFNSSEQFVIIYSSNTDSNIRNEDPHVKHRSFEKWIEDTYQLKKCQWRLIHHIPNKFPFTGDYDKGSLADFYIYKKV